MDWSRQLGFWKLSDYSFYPAQYADLAIRLGVNYIVYAMTR